MGEMEFYYELKKLIEKNNIKHENLIIKEKEIEYKELCFWWEEIWIGTDYCIAENRTPKQCLEIIRNLIS